MSTIASPRDPSAPFPRRANSSIVTPTSSSRPSLDIPASASGSPNPTPPSTTTTTTNPQNKRANRAALREYYNLRSRSTPTPTPTVAIIADTTDATTSTSTSIITNPFDTELDQPDFDPAAYASRVLATASLADLLRTYARIVSEMRALDAEKKALVYDNYSKLIAATETIRRMRAVVVAGAEHQPPSLAAAGGTLDVVVGRIYELASAAREGLRREIAAGGEGEGKEDRDGRRRERTRELAREVVRVPGRVRRLVEEGRAEEARREWEMPRRLLERWKEKGLGGEDVDALIEEGDAALRGAGEAETGAGANTAA
ncbi:hypothetical protein VTK56DRAFT_1450 [Thermocarpiscus australiensis]